MNTAIRPLLSLLALATLCPQFAAAQGSLTPPAGPPVASMKTLDQVMTRLDQVAATLGQVETRIPLVSGQPGVTLGTSVAITISQSGSYYLTQNLTVATANATGIFINADDVTLDLNGYSLICTNADASAAISLGSGRDGCRIRNGSIIGGTTVSGTVFTPAGWLNAIRATPAGTGTRVSDLTVRGVRGDGVDLGRTGTIAERVTVDTCAGSLGLQAGTVLDSTVRAAAGNGIVAGGFLGGGVSNCVAESLSSTASNAAIRVQEGTVNNSRGVASAGTGIEADVITNSSGTSSSSYGVKGSQVSNCRGKSTSGIGLDATTATNCYGASISDIGMFVATAANCVASSVSGAAGLKASTASYCRANRSGGAAFVVDIAVGCTTNAGTITATNKYLMP